MTGVRVPIAEYGPLLLSLRERAGLSRREVARRAGFSPDTARRLEAGHQGVRMDKIFRYGEACGAPLTFHCIARATHLNPKGQSR